MLRPRSILIHGLGIALRRLPAFLWAYAFNLLLAAAFCYPLRTQLAGLLDRSLAAERLAAGFDVGTAADAMLRLQEGSAGQATLMTSHGAIPAYLLLYFLLTPGTLFCYLTRTRARLSTLLHQGMLHFWRFVRITALTMLAAVLMLGPFAVLQDQWSGYVDDHFVGRASLFLRLGGILVVALVASLLRIYFDLVEAYTVQFGAETRPQGKPDRRVRKTLRPAFRLLRDHLLRVWPVFLVLTLAGAVAAFLATRTAMHMLAQPRVWPMFLTAQLGVLAILFTRFWQRGAEASLVAQHPILVADENSRIPFAAKPSTTTHDEAAHVAMIYSSDPLMPLYPAPLSPDDAIAKSALSERAWAEADPIPNPEPAAPSLDAPDPGIFHHEPHKPENDHQK
jgi:hypothetical protein